MPALDGSSSKADDDSESWFTNLFKGDLDEKETRREEKFVLVLAQQPGYVDFTLLDTRGMEATSATASQVRAALALALE